MNYKPVVAWGFYGGASAAETASYACSWGLLGTAPTPIVQLYYRIPTIPVHPIMPTIGHFFVLLYILFT